METEQKNNVGMWIWGIVIILVVVGLIVWAMKSVSAPTTAENTQGVVTNTTDQTALVPVSTEDLTTGDVNATSGATAVSLSYTEALVKYADARLQLDTNCQALASPSNLVFKNNALLMVDNRAPVSRVVRIGSVFTIKAYGFKIIQLSSVAKLPTNWLVDCGTSKNVATITIEK